VVVGTALLDEGERAGDEGGHQRDPHAREKAPEPAHLGSLLAHLLLLTCATGGEELAFQGIELPVAGVVGPLDGGGQPGSAVQLGRVTAQHLPVLGCVGDVAVDA
jgi:hypothetical protein